MVGQLGNKPGQHTLPMILGCVVIMYGIYQTRKEDIYFAAKGGLFLTKYHTFHLILSSSPPLYCHIQLGGKTCEHGPPPFEKTFCHGLSLPKPRAASATAAR